MPSPARNYPTQQSDQHTGRNKMVYPEPVLQMYNASHVALRMQQATLRWGCVAAARRQRAHWRPQSPTWARSAAATTRGWCPSACRCPVGAPGRWHARESAPHLPCAAVLPSRCPPLASGIPSRPSCARWKSLSITMYPGQSASLNIIIRFRGSRLSVL